MRIADFVKAVIADPAKFMPEPRTYDPPAGWFSVEQIRVELNLAYTRNASSRARDLHRRGVLDRQPHRYKAKTGQCHMAYVYRHRPPFKTIKAACDGVAMAQAEKVPAGWVRIVHYAVRLKVSDVALRQRVTRAGLKPRYFKTPRGITGLHSNAFYRESDLKRISR